MDEQLYNDLVDSLVDEINGSPHKVRELVTKVLRYKRALREIIKEPKGLDWDNLNHCINVARKALEDK